MCKAKLLGGGKGPTLAGLVILIWPAPSLQVLAWVSGFALVVLGIFEVIAAFQVRRLA